MLPNNGLPDKNGISKSETGALDAGQCDGQWFAQGALFERNIVRKTVQPLRRMKVPAGQGA
jgi:hypothetical protein